jgi:hypothetical protein
VRSTTAPIAALISVAALALAACGDDSASQAPAPTVTLPPATSTPSTEPAPSEPAPSEPAPTPSTDPAAESDDIVLRIAFEGGFVPVEVAFASPPTLLVTADGRVIQPGMTTMQFPGPLVQPFFQRTITDEGIEAIIALADEYGLLTDVEYESNDNIADAADTVVTLTVGDETYEHRAYALGIDGSANGGESDPDRTALFEFVTAVSDLPTAVGAENLGPEEPYVPDAYLIRATPLDAPPAAEDGIEPKVVDWPADASVALADAAECAEVPAGEVGELFESADQITYFAEGDTTYQLAVTPKLPGRSC